nr:unnamed protein product [Digitaria exilis]
MLSIASSLGSGVHAINTPFDPATRISRQTSPIPRRAAPPSKKEKEDKTLRPSPRPPLAVLARVCLPVPPRAPHRRQKLPRRSEEKGKGRLPPHQQPWPHRKPRRLPSATVLLLFWYLAVPNGFAFSSPVTAGGSLGGRTSSSVSFRV